MCRTVAVACGLVLLAGNILPAAEELTVTLEYLAFDLNEMEGYFREFLDQRDLRGREETAMVLRDVAPRLDVFRGVYVVPMDQPVKHIAQIGAHQVKIVVSPPDKIDGDKCRMEIGCSYQDLNLKAVCVNSGSYCPRRFQLDRMQMFDFASGEIRNATTGALIQRYLGIWYGTVSLGSPHIKGLEFKESAEEPARVPDALDRRGGVVPQASKAPLAIPLAGVRVGQR